jgi:hypothetical protein
MDKKNLLIQRLAGYSATAAAMTALATNVSGQTYSGLKNILVDNTTKNIDLDGDGTSDFAFTNSLVINLYNANQFASLDVTNNKWIGTSMVGAFGPNMMFYGTYPSVSATSINNLGGYYASSEPFAGKGDEYIAVKFGTTNKLGWIRINIPSNNTTLTIRDWAYTSQFYLTTAALTPVISGASISDTQTNAAKLNLTSNAEGIAYFAVQLASVSTTPTAASIKAGTGFVTSGNIVATAASALSLNINGLTGNTDYKVFYIVENGLRTGNVSEIGQISFTTTLNTAVIGIDNEEILSDLFPNPAHGSVLLTVKTDAQYRIIDILGTTLKSGKLKAGQSILDIGSLAKGNYYILITAKNFAITKKLIVE